MVSIMATRSIIRPREVRHVLEMNLSSPVQQLGGILKHPLIELVDDDGVNSVLNNDKTIIEEGLNSIIELLVTHDATVSLLIRERDNDGPIGGSCRYSHVG